MSENKFSERKKQLDFKNTMDSRDQIVYAGKILINTALAGNVDNVRVVSREDADGEVIGTAVYFNNDLKVCLYYGNDDSVGLDVNPTDDSEIVELNDSEVDWFESKIEELADDDEDDEDYEEGDAEEEDDSDDSEDVFPSYAEFQKSYLNPKPATDEDIANFTAAMQKVFETYRSDKDSFSVIRFQENVLIVSFSDKFTLYYRINPDNTVVFRVHGYTEFKVTDKPLVVETLRSLDSFLASKYHDSIDTAIKRILDSISHVD